MKRIASTLVFLTFAITAASAQPATQPPREAAPFESVSVTGTGHVTLTPDRYTFTVGVQTQAPTVEDAVNQNNAKTVAVLAALKKAGATDQEIRTSGFSIYPQQDYTQGQLPRLIGYQVSNSITVTRKQIGDAGKLLQAAISAGVNTASGIQFEVSDPARGRDQGLKSAFDDARAKAGVLAMAAGRSLGRAIAITEGSAPEGPRPVPLMRGISAAAKVSEIPVESGTQELSFTVSAVFELH
jgi:uncharacterized protein YggE